jgi:ribose-phosphate pyrophosphokinase
MTRSWWHRTWIGQDGPGFAKRLNASLAIIDKRRPSANIAEVVNVVGDVEGKDCVIPDDMIDTGGTMTEAIHALKRLGARDVYCCASHALFSGPAVERFMNSPVKEVVVTNTIALPPERKFDRLKVLSVAGLLAKAIGYTHSDQSVSRLFDTYATRYLSPNFGMWLWRIR